MVLLKNELDRINLEPNRGLPKLSLLDAHPGLPSGCPFFPTNSKLILSGIDVV
jgi:hypothetical protein